MSAFIHSLAFMAAAIVLCNLIVLAFRHPRLPRLFGGEFVAMMMGVLVTIMLVGAYVAAVGRIASAFPPGYTTWVMVGVAVFCFALAFVVSAAMGMPRRLRQAREGRSPFARPAPIAPGGTMARA